MLVDSSATSVITHLGHEVGVFFRYQVSAEFFGSIARAIHTLGLVVIVILIVLFFSFVSRLNFTASSKHKVIGSSFLKSISFTRTAETLARCVGSAGISTLSRIATCFIPTSLLDFLHRFFSVSV